MKFIRDIISERRSQKPAEMALPEAAVLPPPLADTPLRRSISAEGPLPLPQRQAEPSRANIFAEAEAMEDFAEPDFLDDEPALAPQASAPAGLVMTEDLGAGFEAEDGSGADPLDGADGPMGGADPFDRLRGAAPEPRAEAAAFSSQRALRLERPILSPREQIGRAHV